MTHHDKAAVVLDDDIYYVARGCVGEVATHGFLHQRANSINAASSSDPCVGMYERAPSGKWMASIVTVLNGDTSNVVRGLGAFDTSAEAINSLWTARHHVVAHVQL